jgi:hypothetical protein
MKFPFVYLWFLPILLGCDSGKQITRLEKQTAELQQEIKRANATIDYDLQGKCARDAKQWFDETWVHDKKKTIFLTFTNHYNKAQNKCFIVVEHHYTLERSVDWANDIMLWDVQENVKYGEFSENNASDAKSPSNKVFSCQVARTKCKSLDEFNRLLQPYTND